MKVLHFFVSTVFLLFSLSITAQDVAVNTSFIQNSLINEKNKIVEKKKPATSFTVKQNVIQVENGKGKMVIRAITGEILKKQTISTDQLTSITISDLSKGRYIIHVIQADGTVNTQHFDR